MCLFASKTRRKSDIWGAAINGNPFRGLKQRLPDSFASVLFPYSKAVDFDISVWMADRVTKYRRHQSHYFSAYFGDQRMIAIVAFHLLIGVLQIIIR